MSEQPDEDQSTDQTTDQTADQGGEPGEVTDSQLPEDLQPGEDNPLATHPDQTGNEDDQIGADREEAPETAPLTADQADYGSGAGGSGSGNGTDGGASSGGDGTGDGRVGSEEDDGSDTLDNGGGGAG
ncbi:hypothetical protein [Nocardioides aurantiacus]|uniref:Uncharacterized protein n=1 Tax=Nocardioides aurantiacus TaxID=86796 RepID=A0A3N2CR17_9ACTN|nr:hypothetical protein [Nocardioides aurantiacus]ROR89977.1 hypothetical protein EDD33_0808 [Nocardioides aurantiacus]